MKRPDDMTLEELREELSDRLISPKAEELDFNELVAIKESMDIEDLKNELIWNGLTTKAQVLESIRNTAAQCQSQIEEMKKMGHSWWWLIAAARMISETLSQLEQRLQEMDLPDLTEDFFGYTYEVTNSGVVLRKTHFEWEDATCGREEETDILELPLAHHFINEHGYEMEGEYELYDS